ncbi:MAG: toll/interleukin-1 receptor domain-containing protein [Nitrosotalea sp.]
MQAFISYSFQDKEIKDKLKKTLQSNGTKCYDAIHDEDFGNSLPDRLENAIDDSDFVIVILTKNSILSSSVGSEIGYAKKAKKRIIPLVESSVSIPVFLQGKEEARFTHDTVDDACRKISKFVNMKLKDSKKEVANDNSTEETVVIERGSYQMYSYDLDAGETLIGQIISDMPVNIFIVNDRNLKLLDENKEFTAEYATRSVLKSKINFHPNKANSWNIIISHEENDDDQDEAEVDVFLDIK